MFGAFDFSPVKFYVLIYKKKPKQCLDFLMKNGTVTRKNVTIIKGSICAERSSFSGSTSFQPLLQGSNRTPIFWTPNW